MRDQRQQIQQHQQTKNQPVVSEPLHFSPNQQTVQQYTLRKVIDEKHRLFIEKSLAYKYTKEQFQELLQAVCFGTLEEQHFGIIGIRKIYSTSLKMQIIRAIIPHAISYAKQDEWPQLKLEGIWILANIAGDKIPKNKLLIENDIIPLLQELLKSNINQIVEKSILVLGNLASDIMESGRLIRNQEMHVLLSRILSVTQCQEIIKLGCWAISNITRAYSVRSEDSVIDALLVVSKLIVEGKLTDKQTIDECFWSISQHAGKDRSKELLLNIMPTVFKSLQSMNNCRLAPHFKILRGISSFEDTVKLLLQAGIWIHLEFYINSCKVVIKIEVARIILNLISISNECAQMLTQNPYFVKSLLSCLQFDHNSIKNIVAEIFANLTLKSQPKALLAFYQQCLISRYYALLLKDMDLCLILTAFQCLTVIFDFYQLGSSHSYHQIASRLLLQLNGAPLDLLKNHELGTIRHKTAIFVNKYLIDNQAY